ncbi:hypothetical protein IAQ76_001167 [Salmonella enterica]|nr:hypothetical protein [Salmonella enterica]
MLIVNALRYAEHSRAGHYIAGRTNHRFVRYITASTTCKIVVRHWRLEPSTTLITDFTGAFPATGLARLPQCQSGIWHTSKNGWSSVSKFTLYPKNSIDLGRFKLCINSYRIDGKEMAETAVVPTDEPDINGEMNWRASNWTQYPSYFMGITCFN